MALTLDNFQFPKAARRKLKRVGRGKSSGHGKTSCRGQKGQNSRQGGGVRIGFEGGQMPLFRRIPKRGFHNLFRVEYETVNLESLKDVAAGTRVDVDWLKEKGLVRRNAQLVKVLGDGEAPKNVTVCAHKFSQSAESKIKEAGGAVEVIKN
ncbi:MAG: 50S ribosomal protein L15 [Candidatus Riflebacteria bacterium]|nr:50S ribosomal protein L15 [Candidatus Riflebacteria bacterium]